MHEFLAMCDVSQYETETHVNKLMHVASSITPGKKSGVEVPQNLSSAHTPLLKYTLYITQGLNLATHQTRSTDHKKLSNLLREGNQQGNNGYDREQKQCHDACCHDTSPPIAVDALLHDVRGACAGRHPTLFATDTVSIFIAHERLFASSDAIFATHAVSTAHHWHAASDTISATYIVSTSNTISVATTISVAHLRLLAASDAVFFCPSSSHWLDPRGCIAIPAEVTDDEGIG
jgi:hypothetical protein